MLVEATRTEAGGIFIGTHITETVASGQDDLTFQLLGAFIGSNDSGSDE